MCIRGFQSEKSINLAKAYTRDFIPDEKTLIPTPETAKQWPHLKSLTSEISPIQDCEIGLLIGYNCLQALLPREIISGKDDQPFLRKLT